MLNRRSTDVPFLSFNFNILPRRHQPIPGLPSEALTPKGGGSYRGKSRPPPRRATATQSPLAEHARHLVAQRLDHVLQRRARISLHEDLGLHAGNQRQPVETFQFAARQRYPHSIVAAFGRAGGRLVVAQVGRDQDDLAGEVGVDAALARQDAHHGVLPERDLIDVSRLDLRLDDQFVVARDDLHQHFAVADDAADRMHGELIDGAVLGRDDVDALELVLRRDQTLGQLGDLALRVAQVLEHFGAEILVELDDLKPGLVDLAFGARHFGDVLPALAREPRPVTPQLHDAVDGDQVLLPQLVDALQLGIDQRYLLLFRRLLRLETENFLVRLDDPFLELCPLAGLGQPAGFEQLALTGKRAGDLRIALAREQSRREGHMIVVVALGHEPRETRLQFIELNLDDADGGARHRVVETDHDLPCFHPVAVVHVDLGDDAAGRVLHLLDAGPHDEAAGRDDRAGDMRGRGPYAGAAEQQRKHAVARHLEAAHGPHRIPPGRRHHWPVSVPHTTRTGAPIAAGRAGAVKARMTSSRAPKACCVPFASTSTLSQATKADGRCAIMTTIAPRALAPSIAA